MDVALSSHTSFLCGGHGLVGVEVSLTSKAMQLAQGRAMAPAQGERERGREGEREGGKEERREGRREE